MSKFSSYADYELPLLQVLSDLPGGQGTAKDVRDRFGERFDDRIPDEHRVFLENVRDIKWRNIVAWARKALVKRGFMAAPANGIWAITEAGRARLKQALGAVLPTLPPPPARSEPPVSTPDRTYTLTIDGRSVTVSARQVLAAARREIARGLPAAAHDFHSWTVEIDGQRVGVKWLFGITTGMAHADFKLNHARRAFERLGLAVRQIEGVPERTDRSERPKVEAQREATPEVHSIADAHVSSIRDFLHGRAIRPSDERLCDWVNFCYEFGLYREGRDLFRLVDPSQVNEWYYARSGRLARICAMKVSGQA